jgi:hypothetical protein
MDGRSTDFDAIEHALAIGRETPSSFYHVLIRVLPDSSPCARPWMEGHLRGACDTELKSFCQQGTSLGGVIFSQLGLFWRG